MQFILVLFAGALAYKYALLFIAVGISLWAAHAIGRGIAQHDAAQRAAAAAERARVRGLAARAHQQHNWRMQGDPRGVYGDLT